MKEKEIINIDNLIKDLKRLGHKIVERVEELSGKSETELTEEEKSELKEKKDFIGDINKVAFRLLEQVRLGNKDNVFYMLLRCFKANNQIFPNELIEAFKQENEKYFKTLIFSFLAPILSREEKNKRR